MQSHATNSQYRLLCQKDVEVIHEDFYIVMWILYDNMEIVVVHLFEHLMGLKVIGQNYEL